MDYAQLGRSGLIVSRLAFGAMTFSAGNRDLPGIYKSDAAMADRLVGQALDAGITLFDTADVYAGGESETLLGRRWARAHEVALATKVGVRAGTAIADAGLSRRHIMASIDRSLRRLGTDWIDLYIAHCEDPLTPLEETLTALDALVQAGKVRYLGFSNWSAWRAATAMTMMRANSLAPFTHGQVYYSLLARDVEHELLPMAQHHGLGLTAWSPLAGGFLSGKYRRDTADASDSRYAGSDLMPVDRVRGFALIDAMEPLARRHDASVAQIAIAWLLSRPFLSSVLLGASGERQLADTLAAATLRLPPEDLATLDAASATAIPYPRWYADKFGDRQRIEIGRTNHHG